MRTASLLSLAFLAACLPACAGSFEEARMAGAPHYAVSLDPPECAGIDAARRNWGAASAAAAVAGGGSGLASIPVEGKEARIALLSAGAAVGVFAAIAKMESDSFAADWVRECGATGVKGAP